MTRIAITLAILSSTLAHAATAYWTGRSEYVTTVTYRSGVRCEYDCLGTRFWRVFVGASCPASVEVY